MTSRKHCWRRSGCTFQDAEHLHFVAPSTAAGPTVACGLKQVLVPQFELPKAHRLVRHSQPAQASAHTLIRQERPHPRSQLRPRRHQETACVHDATQAAMDSASSRLTSNPRRTSTLTTTAGALVLISVVLFFGDWACVGDDFQTCACISEHACIDTHTYTHNVYVHTPAKCCIHVLLHRSHGMIGISEPSSARRHLYMYGDHMVTT